MRNLKNYLEVKKTNIVFPQIKTPDAYFILKHKGAVLIGGWRLKQGGAYFKDRKIIQMKFQNFVNISFQINNYHYDI